MAWSETETKTKTKKNDEEEEEANAWKGGANISVSQMKPLPLHASEGGEKYVKTAAAADDDESSNRRREKSWRGPPTRVSVVRSPLASDASLSLHVQEEDTGGDQQSSKNMWQVYALGAFMVGRWVWGRWRERRAGGDDNTTTNNNED